MRIRVMSDVHLEFGSFNPPDVPSDVVVLAGDIGEGTAGLEWARRSFPNTPVLYVVGNHELYGHRLPDAYSALEECADRLGVYLLEKKSIVFNGVRFMGATLWTDFAFRAKSEEDIRRNMFFAEKNINDYRLIKHGPKRRKQRDRLTPDDALRIHQCSEAWLRNELLQPFDGKSVVVTHHAPHEKSVPANWVADASIPCYASQLDHLLRGPIDLWIHGHIHASLDYCVNATRVVANARGSGWLNPSFNPELVINV